jgi:hypothetical protein
MRQDAHAFPKEQNMIRNQYEQDERSSRFYGLSPNALEQRSFGYGQAGPYASIPSGYGLEADRFAQQWQVPQPVLGQPSIPQTMIGPFAMQAGFPQAVSPNALPYAQQFLSYGQQALPLDPMSQLYLQNAIAQNVIAQNAIARGAIGQPQSFAPNIAPNLLNPALNPALGFRPLNPSLYEHGNRLIGSPALFDLDPTEIALQQRLLQQQLRRQQLAPPTFRGVGPKDYLRSDELVRDEICERLTRHPDIDASDIAVTVRQGIVALTGSVTDRAIKHETEDLIENVIGVKDIENHLIVRPRVLTDERTMVGRTQASLAEPQVSKPRH